MRASSRIFHYAVLRRTTGSLNRRVNGRSEATEEQLRDARADGSAIAPKRAVRYPISPQRTAIAASQTSPAKQIAQNTAAEPKSLILRISTCRSRVT